MARGFNVYRAERCAMLKEKKDPRKILHVGKFVLVNGKTLCVESFEWHEQGVNQGKLKGFWGSDDHGKETYHAYADIDEILHCDCCEKTFGNRR